MQEYKYNKYVFVVKMDETHRGNREMEDVKDEPKKWAKPNIKPETLHMLKKIAVDENLYIYQLVDEMIRKQYPYYFRGC